MTKVMNVAMIGGGFMGKAHAMAYASMPMFFWPAPAIPHRKVVVDITDGAAEDARRRFGFDEASSDWRSVVARPDIDVVDICTPNNVHAEIAIAAAKAGKHIICEKPLARTVEEARAMTEAAQAAGIIHMVAFNYRRTPAVALAKKYIDEGRIGRILNFRGTYLQDWWRMRTDRCPGAFRRRSRGPARWGISAPMSSIWRITLSGRLPR
jgi:predicted dehydrogenase